MLARATSRTSTVTGIWGTGTGEYWLVGSAGMIWHKVVPGIGLQASGDAGTLLAYP